MGAATARVALREILRDRGAVGTGVGTESIDSIGLYNQQKQGIQPANIKIFDLQNAN